jgi:hypothetical protein
MFGLGCAMDVGSDTQNATDVPLAAVECNGGAMVVEPSIDSSWEHVATVYDEGVVDWLVAQSTVLEEVPVVGESNTPTATVQKAFPWMVTVIDDPQGRRLEVRDLRKYGAGTTARYATSGPGGVTVEWVGPGMRLTVNGSKMLGSHAVAYYEVGSWLFESCQLASDP